MAKLVNQIKKLQDQLTELQKANGLLNDQLNALGRAGQISVPMVNMDRLASRLRQDAQCLAPDLQKLIPDVEYDDATLGSICAAGAAYRKSIWQIGRASSRGRGCTDVAIWGGAVTLKKN